MPNHDTGTTYTLLRKRLLFATKHGTPLDAVSCTDESITLAALWRAFLLCPKPGAGGIMLIPGAGGVAQPLVLWKAAGSMPAITPAIAGDPCNTRHRKSQRANEAWSHEASGAKRSQAEPRSHAANQPKSRGIQAASLGLFTLVHIFFQSPVTHGEQAKPFSEFTQRPAREQNGVETMRPVLSIKACTRETNMCLATVARRIPQSADLLQ